MGEVKGRKLSLASLDSTQVGGDVGLRSHDSTSKSVSGVLRFESCCLVVFFVAMVLLVIELSGLGYYVVK
jgi:hypothetical protein